MKVKLIAYTQLNKDFLNAEDEIYTDGQAVALSAIRTCYSHNKPSEILDLEKDKYFEKEATDGEGGTDAERLFRHIVKSGHTSTLEHLNYTFSIEGVSRSLLAQLTRHRHFSYSVQSQRYVKFGTEDKSEGFDVVIPNTIENSNKVFGYNQFDNEIKALELFKSHLKDTQELYDRLRKLGVPAEDARYVLPNAATCNLVLTGNLRSILDFFGKRSSKQAQWEIRDLADLIKAEVVKVEKWTEQFFG